MKVLSLKSHLVPWTDDPTIEHKEVTHGNQTAPDEQGKKAEKLFEDWLDADEDEDGEKNGQSCGHSHDEGHVVLHVLWKHNDIMTNSLKHSLADKEENILLRYAEKEQLKKRQGIVHSHIYSRIQFKELKDFSMIQCQNSETD